jgi:tetratricopeptide (TPR) repeat protein
VRASSTVLVLTADSEWKGELAMKMRMATVIEPSSRIRSLRSGIGALACVAALIGTVGCSRDHIEAINLANEGDRAVKVNVEGAIQKYEEARQLDPDNHSIQWKLAKAYEKKEDWEKMASTLATAAEKAPTFANYWFKRGYALLKIAAAGKPDAYEEAKAPLQKCIEADPNYAECYHFLGEALEWTDDPQGALANYAKAIEHDPTTGYFYPALADLLITYKMYKEADAVLQEGAKLVPLNEHTQKHLYAIHVLTFQVAQARDDKAAMLVAAEKAHDVGQDQPDSSFMLGSTYAIQEPPQKEKAVRLLKSFTKRACAGSNNKKYKEQCETAGSMLQQLGGQGG